MTTAPLPAPPTVPAGARHACPNAGQGRCRISNPGRPRTERCPVCGGRWFVTAGWHTVQEWRQDNRYTLDTATSRHTFEHQATSSAATRNRTNPVYVVRFIREA